MNQRQKMLSFNEGAFKLRGHVEIFVDGEKVFEDPNVVTNKAKTNMARLLAGVEMSSRYVTEMEFGTGGHVEGDTSTPISPSETDNALEIPVIAKEMQTVEFPTSYSVKFVAQLDTDEAVGYTITEYGLKFSNGDLCARKTVEGIAKTSSNVITVYWTIYWT